MICNKCGVENPDVLRFCRNCGHKLQSAQEDPGAGLDALRRLKPIDLLKDSPGVPIPGLGKYLEAWAVVFMLWAGAGFCLWLQAVWPFYPLAGAACLYAWGRGIGYKDE